MFEYCVYFLQLSSGYFYIGSTSKKDSRINSHIRELNKGTHYNDFLQKAWNNLSNNESYTVTFFYVDSRNEAFNLEQKWISYYLTTGNPFLTNICPSARGGDNFTRHPNREEIIRNRVINQKIMFSNMGETRRKEIYGKNGSKNPMYGKKHTPEVRRKISEFLKGHSFNKGCKLSSEHIEKIRARQKLRTGSKNSFYGKKHSDSTKQKLRNYFLGKVPTNIRSVTADGIVFKSCADVSRYYKISQGLVTYRLKNKKWPTWFYTDTNGSD